MHKDTGFFILLALMASLVLLTACSSTVVYRCPPLSPPPASTIDVLEAQGRKDPSTASWVIDLDKHYQKCDKVNRT